MKTILLVSAEPSVRAAVSGAFRLHCDEFSVLQVGEAHKAIEAMRTHRVDLLLTAPCAPVLECFRLLAYLLNYRPRQPVMMSTRKAQRLAWWQDRPAATWQWWPGAEKPNDG